jgi:hypothetical protein
LIRYQFNVGAVVPTCILFGVAKYKHLLIPSPKKLEQIMTGYMIERLYCKFNHHKVTRFARNLSLQFHLLDRKYSEVAYPGGIGGYNRQPALLSLF